MMNREILFRGKRKDNGEWIEGTLYPNGKWLPVFDKDDMYIGNSEIIRAIVPETVGEYTGATDKTGKRIFNDDIVKLQINHTSYYIVEWHKYQWIFRYISRKTEYYQFDTIDNNFGMKNGISEKVEIIGNIYDNPDLLEWRG